MNNRPDPFASPTDASSSPRSRRVYIIRGPFHYYRLCHDKDEAHSIAKSLSDFNKRAYHVEIK